MKLSELNTEINKLGKNKNAILTIIDMKVTEELKTFTAEIKSLNFKLATLSWALVVIVLGFLAKIAFGV